MLFGTERVFPAQFQLLQADPAVVPEGHHVGKASDPAIACGHELLDQPMDRFIAAGSVPIGAHHPLAPFPGLHHIGRSRSSIDPEPRVQP